MTWRHISDCLDAGLMARLIGYDVVGNPLIDAGEYEAADCGDLVQVARPAYASNGSPYPAAVIRLVVDNGMGGGPACMGVGRPGRRRSAGGNALNLVWDSERVHQAASLFCEGHSNSMASGPRR
jgi:hypothetical protein